MVSLVTDAAVRSPRGPSVKQEGLGGPFVVLVTSHSVPVKQEGHTRIREALGDFGTPWLSPFTATRVCAA